MVAENSQNRGPDRLAHALEGALDWWREAGVTTDFSEVPADLLAAARADRDKSDTTGTPAAAKPDPSKAGETVASDEPAQIGGEPALWPDSLEGFARWWMEEPSLEAGGTGPRIAPRGPKDASLMVLVSQPAPDDGERLLEGRHGQFLSGFLRAAGIAEDSVYLASALPRAVAMPNWAWLKDRKLGAILAHHIAIARPARVLVLSRNILPLMDHDMAQGAHLLTRKHGIAKDTPVLGAAGIEELLRSAQRRKRFWQDWLDWTAG